MELAFAWYPIAKFLVSLVLFGLIIFTALKEHYKTAGVIAVVYLILSIFSPVKIDGTNSVSTNKKMSMERTNEYRIVESESKGLPLPPPPKSFAERLADEEARSALANKKLEQELFNKED